MPETSNGPEPIFTSEDGLEELWVKAYQGEVLRELLLGVSPSNSPIPTRPPEIKVLATLERRTRRHPRRRWSGRASRPIPIPRCRTWPWC